MNKTVSPPFRRIVRYILVLGFLWSTSYPAFSQEDNELTFSHLVFTFEGLNLPLMYSCLEEVYKEFEKECLFTDPGQIFYYSIFVGVGLTIDSFHMYDFGQKKISNITRRAFIHKKIMTYPYNESYTVKKYGPIEHYFSISTNKKQFKDYLKYLKEEIKKEEKKKEYWVLNFDSIFYKNHWYLPNIQDTIPISNPTPSYKIGDEMILFANVTTIPDQQDFKLFQYHIVSQKDEKVLHSSNIYNTKKIENIPIKTTIQEEKGILLYISGFVKVIKKIPD